MSTSISVILAGISFFFGAAWREAFSVGAVAALLVSAYRAWAKERNALIAAQNLWQDPIAALQRLSEDVLEEASRDRNGQVWRNQDNCGLNVVTNNREFVSGPVARGEARWDGALAELRDAHAMQQATTEVCFHATDFGFRILERLQQDRAVARVS